MIFSFGFSVLNVADKLQVSISENIKVGDRIKRESEWVYTELNRKANDFIRKPKGCTYN